MRFRPALAVTLALAAAATAGPVDYATEVKPILARYCVSCHGPDKQRGGLRLDTVVGLELGGDRGKLLAPGDPRASLLIQALDGTDDLERMPPRDPRPTADEVQKLTDWVRQGAKAPPDRPHWAFQPVTKPLPPRVSDESWVKNPIDRFILARLEAQTITPSPEADRATLLRRVSLDLTGLVPTPEEVQAFVSDAAPDAYERQVARLLASPHYGERWGRHWLDQARYADSHGYSIDAPRSIWPYRDWVIAATNRDLPFDEFTVAQLAGDLLPDATVDQKIATGFHRNTQINQEGGVDPEQFRVEAVVDRTNTTGSVWLGLTVACAQCHTHKFDPITHADYFSLFAFFNAQDDVNLTLDAAKGAKPTTTMVLRERSKPRPTHVLAGGDFTRPAAKVTADTPEFLPPLKVATPTRLDLARWLVSDDNPLTARVTVNRVWGRYFGVGLVETENDFGTQGSPPSHPGLLDYLASEFRSPTGLGWSMKKLHTLIVTSATYRQSSQVRPGLTEVDPANRLLARQNRLRLDAEVVRDVALSASGLLNATVGGPSVFPPQPEGVSRVTQVARAWPASAGPDRYRRGLYTAFYRSSPHPSLTVFDAPDAQTACTRRVRSNTPLQALTLLNDAAFYEFAHGLALRVFKQSPAGTTPERIQLAARFTLSRDLTERELAVLLALYDAEARAFVGGPESLEKLFQGGGPGGASLKQLPGVPPADKAALVAVGRALLNLDEAITRE